MRYFETILRGLAVGTIAFAVSSTVSANLSDISINETQRNMDSTYCDVQTLQFVNETNLTDEEIDLIALVTMAEAESEGETGKRLVIDTILNRVDSPFFPNTVNDVIYQPNQFGSLWNGRMERAHATDEVRQLVTSELQSRTNYDVVYYREDNFAEYGVPRFCVGNHYFSSYF